MLLKCSKCGGMAHGFDRPMETSAKRSRRSTCSIGYAVAGDSTRGSVAPLGVGPSDVAAHPDETDAVDQGDQCVATDAAPLQSVVECRALSRK
jgi:hypothetical protein